MLTLGTLKISTGRRQPPPHFWHVCILSSSVVSDSVTPLDCSPPGSSVHGILQARILEWVAVPSSRGSSWPRDPARVSMSPALAGGLFTTSTSWEAHAFWHWLSNIRSIWKACNNVIARLLTQTLGVVVWETIFLKSFWLILTLMVWYPHFENCFRTSLNSG